jgi:surface antigen
MRCVCLQGSASCISKEDTLQTQQLFWKGFQQYNVVSFVASSCIVAALVLYFANITPCAKVKAVHIRPIVISPCVYPFYLNLLFTGQSCISEHTSQTDHKADIANKMLIAAKVPVGSVVRDGPHTPARQAMPAIQFVPLESTTPFQPLLSTFHGSLNMAEGNMPLSASTRQGSAYNVFPYGQCTWWANQRYNQLHGSFVPWRTNANAFQWVARATEAGWHVSGIPTVGSIMVLQPHVDGAYGLGHVGVVERILPDGRAIASSMNWGNHPSTVTQATYALGPGVNFISSF